MGECTEYRTYIVEGNFDFNWLFIYSRLEHPNRVLTQLFEKLEQQDVIRPESFLQWKQNEDSANLPGKGVCVNSTTQFFVWLQENTEEEEENEE